MLELFSRRPDLIAEIPDMHLTPIPGQPVRQDDIDKHKRDVIRVTAALTPGDVIETPSSIKADLQKYIDIIREENPDTRQILRADISIEQIFDVMVRTFGLENEVLKNLG